MVSITAFYDISGFDNTTIQLLDNVIDKYKNSEEILNIFIMPYKEDLDPCECCLGVIDESEEDEEESNDETFDAMNRVIEEKYELMEKYSKLKDFVKDSKFEEKVINSEQRELMYKQLNIMGEYIEILSTREALMFGEHLSKMIFDSTEE